uniref:HCO3_cotransp domain-containing protein n=1 Tax=Macrostomum lignano TaxID=282301 RepID=A0A1I8F5F8_9PLAT
LYYLVGLVGPASGYFLLGGIIVNIYVDLDKPKELSPSDEHNLWSYGDSAQRSAQLTVTMKDFLPTAGIIFSIPTFVCLTLAGTAASITITGLPTFGPKLMQQFFRMAASTATLTNRLVPCGALGLFTGAMVIRFVAMPVQRFDLDECGSVNNRSGSRELLRCALQSAAACRGDGTLSRRRSFVPDMDPNFSAPWQLQLQLRQEQVHVRSGVLRGRVLHFSPCFAGCSETLLHTNSAPALTTTKLMHDRNISAISGDCPSTECTSAPLFLTLVGCFMFCMFFITIPTLQAIMRNCHTSVRPQRGASNLKDFGIAFQLILTIASTWQHPAPLLLGRLIDTTCSVWNSSSAACRASCCLTTTPTGMACSSCCSLAAESHRINFPHRVRRLLSTDRPSSSNRSSSRIILTVEIRRRGSNSASAVNDDSDGTQQQQQQQQAVSPRRLSGTDNPA